MVTHIPTIRFITIFPDLIDHYLKYGVMKKALELSSTHAKESQGVCLKAVDLRGFAEDPHRTVDGRPYGGIDGMVLRADVLARAVNHHPGDFVIYASPRAPEYFCQSAAESLVERLHHQDLCFICGRFSGIDERFESKYVDQSYSLGDFVASGGELPSLMMVEAIVRLYPGVLGNQLSYQEDSFGSTASWAAEYPLYTKPRQFEGLQVPAVLLSGDHQAIDSWKKKGMSERKKRFKS